MSDYENARIINLSPEKDTVVSFEEAFGGEYSNASGKRQAKREEKRENRQEKRVNRIENKNVRKETRGVGKQVRKENIAAAKVNRKSNKRVLKQQGRTAAASERINRNTIKQDARIKSQAEQDAARESKEEVMPSDDVANSTEPTTSQAPNYEAPTENLMQQEEQDPGTNTEESAAPTASDVAMETDDTAPNASPQDEAPEEDWAPDFESSFSGDKQFSTEATDSENAIVVNIHPVIRKAAEKQVFHELKAHKFRNKIGKGGNDMEAQTQAQLHMQQAKKVSNFLEEYCNAAGGKKGAYRRNVVNTAMKEARDSWKNKISSKQKAAGSIRVAQSLDPQLSKDKIIIPAEESSSASGSRTTQEIVNAENNPNTRVFEETSNATGPLKNPDWKSYLVGLGLAIGVIIVLKSTNVLKFSK